MSKCGKLGPLADYQVTRTMAEGCLVPTADMIRQLATDFGLRPYRVFLVWVGWTRDVNGDGAVTGKERYLEPNVEGVGRAVLLKEVELLPTPLVEGLSGISGELESTGLSEAGGVTVSEISIGYTEDQLQGLIPEYRDPDHPDTLRAGVTFFWEIQQNRPGSFAIAGTAAATQFRPDPLRSPRRRFQVNQVPTMRAGSFEWVVGLAKADGERGRNGDVRAVEGAYDDGE